MSMQTDTNEVLTLHRGVESRWQSERSVGVEIGARHSRTGITDTLMAGLPGLASLDGRFGADAFDIASMISLDAGILAAGGLTLRAMSVAELADIVQIIIEQEEASQGELRSEGGGRDRRGPRSGRVVTRPGQAAKLAAVRRAVARAREQAANRRQARRMHAAASRVRLAGLGARSADASEIAAAELEFEQLRDSPAGGATGDSMSAEPDDVGYADPGALGLHRLAHALRADAALARSLTGVSFADRRVFGELDPRAAVGAARWARAGSRALHWADAAAELAMLQPGLEPVVGAPSGPVAGRPRGPGALDAFDAVREQAVVARHEGSTLGYREARRLTALRARANAPALVARTSAGGPTVASDRLRAFTASWRPTAALADPTAPAGPSTVALPGRMVEAGSAPPLAALRSASNFTASHLRAHARRLGALAPAIGASEEGGPAARPPHDPALRSPLSGLSFGSADAAASVLFGVIEAPALTVIDRWLTASTPAMREGYHGTDTGAGTALTPGLIPGADPASFETARSHGTTEPAAERPAAPAAAPTLRSSGHPVPAAYDPRAPAWLAPAAARSPVAARPFIAGMTAPGMPAAEAGTGLDAPAYPGADGARSQGSWTRPAVGGGGLMPSVPGVAATASRALPGAAPTFTSAIPGAAGLYALSLSRTVGERLVAGIEPAGIGAAWRPQGVAWQPGRTLMGAPGRPLPGSAGSPPGEGYLVLPTGQVVDALGLPLAIAGEFARGDVFEFGGALGRESGAGEWLLPGDDGFEPWRRDLARSGSARPPKPAALGATRQPAARGVIERASTAHGAAAPPTASRPLSSSSVARSLDSRPASPDRPAPSDRPAPLARAFAAAIDRFLSTHALATGIGGAEVASQVASLASAESFALAQRRAAGHPVLGILPAGGGDALTPWLVQRALGEAPSGRAFAFVGAADTELVDLGKDQAARPAESIAEQARGRPRIRAAASAPRVSRGAGGASASIARLPAAQRRRIGRLLRQRTLPKAVAALGSGALDVASPAGLRAALALLGELEATLSPADLGARFVERFFGRVSSEAIAGAAGELPMTILAPPAEGGGGPFGETTPTSGASRAAGTELVIEGLAGLAALRALDMGGAEAQRELLALGAREETRASATPAGSSRGATGRGADSLPGAGSMAPKPAPSVAMHRFTPVGLGRGRRLLGRSRSGAHKRLLTASRSTRSFRSRVGYGHAGLGSGPLLGLTGGDESFYGGDFGYAAGLARAERLSEAVRARRGTRPGHVGRSLGKPVHVHPSAAARRQAALGLPTDFSADTGVTYVDPSAGPASSQSMRFDPRRPTSSATTAAVQAAASAPSTRGGVTQQARAGRAASVARVLSVTASPTANVLPLVAPAARAIATAAAAKPIAESISTSGSNPSMVAPMAGHDIAGQTAGGPGQGSTEKERAESGGTAAQELDQLAMKIARSVMIRIKRERERRGLHG